MLDEERTSGYLQDEAQQGLGTDDEAQQGLGTDDEADEGLEADEGAEDGAVARPYLRGASKLCAPPLPHLRPVIRPEGDR